MTKADTPPTVRVSRPARAVDEPQQRIDLSSPLRWRTFWTVVVSLLGCFLAYPILLAVGQNHLAYMAVYSDEGILESIGAYCCATSAILFFFCYWDCRTNAQIRVDRGRPGQMAFYFVLALLAVVMLGEELAWGARLVHWVSGTGGSGEPITLARLIQPPRSTIPVAMTWWMGGMIVYFAVVPAVARVVPAASQSLVRWRLPLPSGRLAFMTALVALASAVLAFRPSLLWMGSIEVEEAVELALEILLLAWAIEERARVRGAIDKPSSLGPTIAVTSATVVSLLLGSMDVSTRTYPASVGQHFFILGRQQDMNGDEENAIENYQRAIEAYPLNDAAQYRLGVLLDRRNRLAEALPHLELAVQIAPNTWEYQYALAIAYAKVWTGPSLRASLEHVDIALGLVDRENPERVQMLRLQELLVTFKRAGEHAIRQPGNKEILKNWQQQMRKKAAAATPFNN